MITIAGKTPTTTRPTFGIRLDGEPIGEIEPYLEDEWHAIIKLKIPGEVQTVLIQGFADTGEKAIDEAIDYGMRYHQLAVAAIARLQEQRKAGGN